MATSRKKAAKKSQTQGWIDVIRGTDLSEVAAGDIYKVQELLRSEVKLREEAETKKAQAAKEKYWTDLQKFLQDHPESLDIFAPLHDGLGRNPCDDENTANSLAAASEQEDYQTFGSDYCYCPRCILIEIKNASWLDFKNLDQHSFTLDFH